MSPEGTERCLSFGVKQSSAAAAGAREAAAKIAMSASMATLLAAGEAGALRRLTAELERLRRKFGHVDYARLVRAPTAEWVAGEDALLDTLICKREALLICETLDLHLVTAAVTGDMRLAWGTNGGRGGLLHRLNALKSGMRYGDVDTGPGAPPRRWGEAPGDRDVVWWRARWRCGCCEGPRLRRHL